MKLTITRTFLAAAFLSSAAVASADIPLYLKNRGNDFLDLFRLRAGIPEDAKGAGLKARATSLGQAGYVFFKGTYAGIDRRGIGIVEERRHEFGVSALYASFNEMVPSAGNDFLKGEGGWHTIDDRRIIRNLPHWDDGRNRPLSLGAEIATPYIAFDAGLYPGEALDFIGGIFTLDVFQDDEKEAYGIPFRDPQTLPIADPQALFPTIRERNAMEEERLLRLELEKQGELINGDEPDPDSAPGLMIEHSPAPAPAPQPAVPEEPIQQQEADALIEEIREKEEEIEQREAEMEAKAAIEEEETPTPQDEAQDTDAKQSEEQ